MKQDAFLAWVEEYRTQFEALTPVQVDSEEVMILDLSESNEDLDYIDFKDPNAFPDYLETLMQQHNASMAIGGYTERRFVYRDKDLFNDGSKDERFIHLGIDLWMPALTPIFAPIDGTVHSFADNNSQGNYGPTIILKHSPEEEVEFYTLYGHLTRASLEGLAVGQEVKAGEAFAAFGAPEENGGWTPHLHFQLILNIGDYKGDYPGVTSEAALEEEMQNCPNPNLIINCPKLP